LAIKSVFAIGTRYIDQKDIDADFADCVICHRPIDHLPDLPTAVTASLRQPQCMSNAIIVMIAGSRPAMTTPMVMAQSVFIKVSK
jgi:hypothetical protein